MGESGRDKRMEIVRVTKTGSEMGEKVSRETVEKENAEETDAQVDRRLQRSPSAEMILSAEATEATETKNGHEGLLEIGGAMTEVQAETGRNRAKAIEKESTEQTEIENKEEQRKVEKGAKKMRKTGEKTGTENGKDRGRMKEEAESGEETVELDRRGAAKKDEVRRKETEERRREKDGTSRPIP
ncbi:unnamed protein product [Polarella glacialis]|uniref:Uncharacterized protein n=1 Tax=Polarella glacialis TaxID=89957 RepID=A0A813JFV7_POLGL|nr:unnamed protein product [Polarella glacialis]CAE8676120.1 unnamed protein product [Polarella glacialis]